MIDPKREDVLEASLSTLAQFAHRVSTRGRFVSLYLGLRRMGPRLAPLGSEGATPASEVEAFLDELFTKVHRPEPFVVLTAPFGGSTSASAPYSTRTGVIAPGKKAATNTWRNNFGIQKGVGCPAGSAVITAMLANPAVRLACPHIVVDEEDRYGCGVAGTSYRGEEHSIWLRMLPTGYQVVPLNEPMVYSSYLRPGGARIPIFPLIAMLYCFAPDPVYPDRRSVGIPDFAADFGFTLQEVEDLFDCNPESDDNAQFLGAIGGTLTTHGPRPGSAETDVAEGATGIPAPLPAGPLPIQGAPRELNDGVGAELAVAQDLSRHGWSVLYRGNQRLVGYDLEAVREESRLRIEVKSSVGFTTPVLTAPEWEAAQRYGDEYVLAIVDFFGSGAQSIWYVREPAGAATPAEVPSISFRIPRSDIEALRTEAEFL